MAALTAEQRQELSLAAWSAFSAITFVTSPMAWPLFKMWSARQVAGTTWDESDRVKMAEDGELMRQMAQALEKLS